MYSNKCCPIRSLAGLSKQDSCPFSEICLIFKYMGLNMLNKDTLVFPKGAKNYQTSATKLL